MSTELDSKLAGSGTRFRLYPQSPALAAYRDATEVVWVSSPTGSLRPGPSDEVMQVVDAIGKQPYDEFSLPPWRGPVQPPAEPNAAGHFDDHPVGSRNFKAAHMFGAIRRVLDIWENYFQTEINLTPLEPAGSTLELIPQVELERNAQTGFGYIETGYTYDANGQIQPLCLNLDILAHEVGHRIIFAKVGVPLDALTAEFSGFSESASDLVALITALHFDSLVDRVLENSGGNLYVLNELSRFAELSDHDQIRIASNSKRMSDVVDVSTPLSVLTQPELHELGEPLTGALFDVLIDIYQVELVERGAIPADLADEVAGAPTRPLDYGRIQQRFDSAYDSQPAAFRAALHAARDALGRRLALTWQQLQPHRLTFRDVALAFMTVDRGLTGWLHQDAIAADFAWRGIGARRPLGPTTLRSGDNALQGLAPRQLCARSLSEWCAQRRGRSHVPSNRRSADQAPDPGGIGSNVQLFACRGVV